MRKRSAFALTDLLVAILVVAVLLTITAATLADNGTRRQRRLNTMHLRGMHQGLVTFSFSNKYNFPGLDATGNILADSDQDTGGSGDGDTTEARFWIMLTGNFFTPEYALIPFDRKMTAYEESDDPQEVVPVTYENYSYAMLDITGDPGGSADASNRHAEWQLSLNTQAIVMSDRNCSDLEEEEPISIWNDEEWHGAIVYNDTHVSYESDTVFETRYGNGQLNVDANDDPTDFLFTDDTANGDDALMTHSKDEDGTERAITRFTQEEDEARQQAEDAE